MRRVLRLLRRDDGMTITELSVSMVITSLLSTVMIVWVFAGFGSDSTHSSYDHALEDLRDVTDQLSREVRAANGLTVAEQSTMTFWLDSDRDGAQDVGEEITWAILESGEVLRSTDADEKTVIATNLSHAASTFSYDSGAAASVTRVTIDLVAVAATSAGEDQVFHEVHVYLRNK